ncbi:hypothetical protein [Bryobacter aggregatus]|uniref:hypothetical protein n=1 Tax=Bryobacter aggregatus TaxID=360054 RepID=UPI0012BACADB|nr:hypothetical protein [Bryobacter aggregatus]
MEKTANETVKWRTLAGIAIAGLILTEGLRRIVPGPPDARGGALLYWFFDHVFFHGKFLVLAVLALTPQPRRLGLKWVMPLLGAVLMVGSFLQLAHPAFLGLVGLLLGVALQNVQDSESFDILLVMGGLALGIPLNGFTGLMAAKSGFAPTLMDPLFGATAGVGCAAIACSMVGLYLLIWRRIKN